MTTDVTRRDVDWLKEYTDKRFEAMDKATAISNEAFGHRLEALNDVRRTSIPRSEYCAVIERMERQIRELELSKAELAGKASQSAVANAQILALLGLLLGIVGIVLKFV